MPRSIFSNMKLVASSTADTAVSALGAIDNLAQVGVIASSDWRKQAEFTSRLRDKARQRLMANEEALDLIESQMLSEMVGDYLPQSKDELFALPN